MELLIFIAVTAGPQLKLKVTTHQKSTRAKVSGVLPYLLFKYFAFENRVYRWF